MSILESDKSLAEALSDQLVAMATAADDLCPESLEPDTRQRLLRSYLQALEFVGTGAGETALTGLWDACMLIHDGVRLLIEREQALAMDEKEHLRRWPDLIGDYLYESRNPQTGRAIVRALSDPAWIKPVNAQEAKILEEFLIGHTPLAHQEAVPEDWEPAQAPEENANPEPLMVEPVMHDAQAQAAPEASRAPEDIAGPLWQEIEKHQELIDLLRAELAEIIEMREPVSAELTRAQTPEQRRESLLQYAEQAEHVGNAAQIMGLEGLSCACMLFNVNMLQLAGHETPCTEAQREALLQWPVAALGYLQDLRDGRWSEALIDLMRNPAWPEPLPEEAVPELYDLLTRPEFKSDEAPARAQEALPEDVSLALPEDVNAELLDGLLQELPTQTESFSNAIQALVNEASLEDIDVAQRIAHTLKGAANVVGVKGIANLTHHLEDILQVLSKHERVPPAGLARVLIDAADGLESMSDALLGRGEAPHDALQTLQEVLDWGNRIDQGVAFEDLPDVDAPTARHAAPAVEPEPPAPADAPATSATETGESAVRVPRSLADQMLRLAGENMISTGQVQEHIRQVIHQAKALKEQNRALQQLAFELEHMIDIRGLSSHMRARVNEGEFDPLEMDQFNELHSFTRRLVEASTDSLEMNDQLGDQLAALGALALEQDRINKENQDAVMRTRMVPVGSVSSRLKRAVRQACRLTGKQAALEIEGAETLIDSDVLNELVDPLMHLLRNAVDHGIEPPELRGSRGKAAEGLIRLSVYRRGDQIVMRCADDGMGIDLEAVRERAQERGFIQAGQTLGEDALLRLILEPGFTTREHTTQVSGRGIGMDVVNQRIRALKGSLAISSTPDEGSVVEASLPVTLLAAHSLLVRVRDVVYAISSHGVEEVLYPDAGELKTVAEEFVYQLGDNVYGVYMLDEMLGLERDRRSVERESFPVLIVRTEGGARVAVLVQAVLDSLNLVVKPLGRYVPKMKGVVGATILGDGAVAAVLDLPALLQVSVAHSVERGMAQAEEGGADAQRLPYVLVVDDSLSARRSLAQFVKDSGFEVRTANDGMEAVSMIDRRPPDLLLVDMEMPRMNGLELTSHLRASSRTQAMPIVMITSRSTEKHRDKAEAAGVDAYMVKPYAEDELINVIYHALEENGARREA